MVDVSFFMLNFLSYLSMFLTRGRLLQQFVPEQNDNIQENSGFSRLPTGELS